MRKGLLSRMGCFRQFEDVDDGRLMGCRHR
jgi:hypothetical protein